MQGVAVGAKGEGSVEIAVDFEGKVNAGELLVTEEAQGGNPYQ